VTTEALQVVWNQIWSLSLGDQRWVLIKQQFESSLKRFHEKILPLMAWILLAKRLGLRPNVNNLRLQRFLEMDDDLDPSSIKEAMVTVRTDCSCPLNAPLRTWIQQIRRFRLNHPKKYVRGKFELWFFCRFLNLVFQGLRRGDGERPSGSIQITPQSISIALAGKLPIPVTLRQFLEAAARRCAGGHCEN
jgi:hypothetical protein